MAEPSRFARIAGNALYYGALYAGNRYMSSGNAVRKRGIGGANYQGKFGGYVKRPRYAKLDKGYAEKVTFASVAQQPQCLYLGFTSVPTAVYGTIGYSRLLQDVCISILREFFRNYHPGKFEFETPDQDLYTAGLSVDGFNLSCRSPGGGLSAYLTFTPATAANGTTLRVMGAQFAQFLMQQWDSGYEPYQLSCTSPGTGSAPVGIMWLNNLIVKASCTNVVIIQNQSLADDGAAADLDVNTTVDVSANPLKGKMFYMKHVCAEIGTGMRSGFGDPTVIGDTWGANNLKTTTTGTLQNVIAPTNAADGCWKVIPKADYFKNCTGVKDIGLEPGVQKTFKLRFKFTGALTNFLRGEYSNYMGTSALGTGVSAQPSYKQRFGQCVILAFEKRLRQTGSQITVAYQVDTYIRTSIKKKRQYMTYHVETNV